MYKAKTKPTQASFASYLRGIEDEERRHDCKDPGGADGNASPGAALSCGERASSDSTATTSSTTAVTRAIVPSWDFHPGRVTSAFTWPSGYEAKNSGLLSHLGKHKTGKACLYFRRLSDISPPILERLVTWSVEEMRRR